MRVTKCEDAPVKEQLASYLFPGAASSLKTPALPMELACSALEEAECSPNDELC